MSKLAIVIPFYKIDFFEETIKSIASQTNKNFALYIGNDASPENPIPIINKYYKQDEYLYYNYTENIGGHNLALQWERILTNVKEEWFQILGDDDVLVDNFVEEFYKSLHILNDENINVLKFPIEIIDENNITIKKFSFPNSIIDRRFFLISRIEHISLSSLSENIFRTKTFLKHKIKQFPLAWHSDDCMIFDYSENNKILYNKNSFLFVRNSGINISSMKSNQNEKSKATNEFYNYIITNYYNLFTSEQKKTILKNIKKHFYYENYKPSFKLIYTVGCDNIFNAAKLLKYIF